MDSAVLLYTMRCNIRCQHCSVDSHPKRTEKMSLDKAKDLVKSLCCIPELEYIDVSGGEPMLYRHEITELAEAVHEGGKQMRIVTNGFWAKTIEQATAVLTELREAGVSLVGISIDEWHLAFLPPDIIHNYIAACRQIGTIPLLSIVVPSLPTPPTSNYAIPLSVGLALERYGIFVTDCMDMYEWGDRRKTYPPGLRERFDHEVSQSKILLNWQMLTAEGRARALPVPSISFASSVAEPCRMAGHLPTIDEEGRLFPCCSPWVNRKTHAMAQVDAHTVMSAVEQVRDDPLVRLIHEYGPKVLIDAARARGIDFPEHHSGICNQCGMLMDRFSLEELRALALHVVDERQQQLCLRILGLRAKPSSPMLGAAADAHVNIE